MERRHSRVTRIKRPCAGAGRTRNCSEGPPAPERTRCADGNESEAKEHRRAPGSPMPESERVQLSPITGELVKIVSPRPWPASDIPLATTSRRRHHHAAAIAAPVTLAIHPYCFLVMSSSTAAVPVAASSSGVFCLGGGNIRATAVIDGLGTRRASGPSERVAQQELDVRIQTAEIVVGPSLHRVEHGRIDAQQERLAIHHGLTGGWCRC